MSDTDDRRTTFERVDSRSDRGIMDSGLTPTAPAEAVEWYLEHREPDLSAKSLYNQKSRLKHFIRYCEEEDLDNLNELDGRHIHRFRSRRSSEVKPVTLSGELQTFRVFLDFCATVEAVRPGMRELVIIPDLDEGEETKDELLEGERAEHILEQLDKFAYASRPHVINGLLWHTGMRLGALRGIDLDDVDLQDWSMWLKHRPESETPLKNREKSERIIALGKSYVEIIQAYIETHRHDVTDDYGREPLLTTKYGRISEGTVREEVYKHTQPCEWGSCPYDQDPNACEWRHYHKRAGCPGSRGPHSVRTGAMTHARLRGVPLDVVSERMNASPYIVEKHYDKRSQKQRMENRRQYFEED